MRRILCLCLIFLVGCTSNWAPVNDASYVQLSGQHIVKEGETLYLIGWRYNRDYKELAQANGIAPPYEVYVGQKISLEKKESEPPPQVQTPTQAQPVAKTLASQPITPPVAQTTALGPWQWPVKGAIIGRFAQTKGLDIAGVEGELIHAAGAGQVVYSGTGLRGYGQLLIIKHNEQYLSAYAHNKKLLVKEGDQVKIGQAIAQMGNTDTNRVKLHFEIRQNGKPVDPLRYLPKD